MNILFLHILLIWGYLLHPIHVSMCNIEITDKQSIMAIKLFSDDFEKVIENKYKDDFVLSMADKEPYRKYISDYVNSNFKLIVDRKNSIKFLYDYSEMNELSIWLYFKIESLNSESSLTITNSLMLDLYEDQTNLMIINYKGKQNGYKFNIRVKEVEIELK